MAQAQAGIAPASRPSAPLPAYARIKPWCAMSGMSPAGTYRELNKGTLKAIRLGNRVLIDVQHGLAFLRGLPAWQPMAEADAKTRH